MTDHLISPHGGTLIDLVVDAGRATELKEASRDWPSWDLTPRQLCDFELLVSGAFSPLCGFLGKADYEHVVSDMRLADGTLWPMPVTLDVSDALAEKLSPGSPLALRDAEGVMLGVLHVEDVWQPDRDTEAQMVFGTADPKHPGVEYLLRRVNPWYVSGRIEGVQLPVHYDYRRRRRTPAEIRKQFSKVGWKKVVAFLTRTPIHRAEYELMTRAAREVEASLFMHPFVGLTKPRDLDHHARMRCYKALLGRFPKNTASLALLPLAMRLAGPREALWHALIEKNFGCTHLIVGRDHAGPGKTGNGRFYRPYEALEFAKRYEEEVGVGIVAGTPLVYLPDEDRYVPEDDATLGARSLSIPSEELRARLAEGREIPEWFTFPAVAAELKRAYPPRSKQGFTVFLTGLSGSGKSTIAQVLLVKFLEMGGRPVTLLDGDVVRKNLSSELGFSREHRDLNIRRIGFVASEITKNGGIAICAPIAPYDHIRKDNRTSIEQGGGYILVHVSTPLEVCEQRDRKGLYAKARAGILKEFTGISDPYEVPDDADVVIDTTNVTPEEAAQQVILYLERQGYVGVNGG